jgi:alpha-mannosidase
LENDCFRVTIDENGDVASIFDKKNQQKLLASPARLALMYEKPAQWPAWNMDWKDRQQPPRSYVGGPAKIEIAERGPARVALRVTREHEGSTFVQTISLASGAAGDHVEFDNVIDWTTRERSLKAEFPLAVSNPKATYDIQVGAIERDNNSAKRYENPSHQWFDLTDVKGDYGVTIANDCKYGSDKPNDNTLRLTMIYTPGVSGDYQDQGTQDIGRHHNTYAIAGHAGSWRANDAASPWIAARLNQPLRAFIVPPHAGPLGKSFSLLECDNPNVMVTAIKRSEEGDRMIIRLREMTGDDADSVRITMPRPILEAAEVDGQERRIAAASIVNGELVTDVHGFGLRAFEIKCGPAPARINASKATKVELPYEVDVVSTNNQRDDGSIDGLGLTYPAEQLGASIECDGVKFDLGPTTTGLKNAVLCRGQEIALPQGDFNRLELLAASIDGDQVAHFKINDEIHGVVVPWWRGYVGQWDNRVWIGKVPEVAFNWSATFGGLDPGYIKPGEVAWFSTHHHGPKGDQYYEYCYLYKLTVDLPKGARSLTLPDNPVVMLLAATVVNDSRDRAMPASVLFDSLGSREQDAPRIVPDQGSFADATEIRIEPRLYGRADSIHYTIDGSPPSATSPKYLDAMVIDRPIIVRAAVLGKDGMFGPEAKAQINVNDATAPRVVVAESVFNEPVVRLQFSEPLDKDSAGSASNYSFEPKIAVRSAAVDETLREVALTLESPVPSGQSAMLRIRGVKDRSPSHNEIQETFVAIAAPAPVFQLSEVKPEQRGKPINAEKLPVKEGDAWTLNMFVRTGKEPANRTVIAGFGSCGRNGDAQGRYLCKFANGVQLWSHHSDLAPDQDTPLDLNRWQMLTATYDGKVLRLYKDGAQIGEREAHLAADEAVINICPPDPWERKRIFDGDIRELTIWNVALSSDALKVLQRQAKLP